MRILTLVFVFFMSSIFSKAQVNKSLERAINITITALNNQDEKVLNGMILKDFGLAIIFRRGVNDNLSIVEKISIKEPIPEYLPYNLLGIVDAKSKIFYESLPNFDCNTRKFTKKDGIYIDFADRYKYVSKTALAENQYLDAGWKAHQINEMIEIESKSRKIIAFGKSGIFIFYLTLHQDNWYLTMLDRFEACSA